MQAKCKLDPSGWEDVWPFAHQCSSSQMLLCDEANSQWSFFRAYVCHIRGFSDIFFHWSLWSSNWRLPRSSQLCLNSAIPWALGSLDWLVWLFLFSKHLKTIFLPASRNVSKPQKSQEDAKDFSGLKSIVCSWYYRGFVLPFCSKAHRKIIKC